MNEVSRKSFSVEKREYTRYLRLYIALLHFFLMTQVILLYSQCLEAERKILDTTLLRKREHRRNSCHNDSLIYVQNTESFLSK